MAFYEKAFGVPATKVRPGYAKFDLVEPSLNLSMVEGEHAGKNANHFGIQVESTDDVLEAKRRFEAAGFVDARRGQRVVLLRRAGQSLGRGPGWERMGGVLREGGSGRHARGAGSEGTGLLCAWLLCAREGHPCLRPACRAGCLRKRSAVRSCSRPSSGRHHG